MQAFRVTLDSLSGGFTNLNSSAPGAEEKQPAVDSPAARIGALQISDPGAAYGRGARSTGRQGSAGSRDSSASDETFTTTSGSTQGRRPPASPPPTGAGDSTSSSSSASEKPSPILPGASPHVPPNHKSPNTRRGMATLAQWDGDDPDVDGMEEVVPLDPPPPSRTRYARHSPLGRNAAGSRSAELFSGFEEKHDDLLAHFEEDEIFAICASRAMEAHERVNLAATSAPAVPQPAAPSPGGGALPFLQLRPTHSAPLERPISGSSSSEPNSPRLSRRRRSPGLHSSLIRRDGLHTSPQSLPNSPLLSRSPLLSKRSRGSPEGVDLREMVKSPARARRTPSHALRRINSANPHEEEEDDDDDDSSSDDDQEQPMALHDVAPLTSSPKTSKREQVQQPQQQPPLAEEEDPFLSGSRKNKPQRCSACGQLGHKSRTCSKQRIGGLSPARSKSGRAAGRARKREEEAAEEAAAAEAAAAEAAAAEEEEQADIMAREMAQEFNDEMCAEAEAEAEEMQEAEAAKEEEEDEEAEAARKSRELLQLVVEKKRAAEERQRAAAVEETRKGLARQQELERELNAVRKRQQMEEARVKEENKQRLLRVQAQAQAQARQQQQQQAQMNAQLQQQQQQAQQQQQTMRMPVQMVAPAGWQMMPPGTALPPGAVMLTAAAMPIGQMMPATPQQQQSLALASGRSPQAKIAQQPANRKNVVAAAAMAQPQLTTIQTAAAHGLVARQVARAQPIIANKCAAAAAVGSTAPSLVLTASSPVSTGATPPVGMAAEPLSPARIE